MGLGQADLPAAPWVDLGAPRITSPVTSHSVSTKLASVVLTVVLSVVWPPVLPPILPPVVLTLGHQDAHHGQEERLVFSRFIKEVIFLASPMFTKKPPKQNTISQKVVLIPFDQSYKLWLVGSDT